MIRRGRDLNTALGEQLDPVLQSALSALPDEQPPLVFDQRCGGLTVAGCDEVPDGISSETMVGQPASGASVELFDTAERLEAQPLREQRVIAVPLPAVVEWQQEQVEPLQLLEVVAGIFVAGRGRGSDALNRSRMAVSSKNRCNCASTRGSTSSRR